MSSIEECLEYFKNKTYVSADSETKGFDPYTKDLLSLQLGDKENQWVIDCQVVGLSPFKELLESKIIIFQNAKFDLRFLYHRNIIPTKVYDTYLAERVITCGYKDAKKALDFLAMKYCNKYLNKSIRGVIHREGLSDRVIQYAAEDVLCLEEIMEKQLVLLREQDLLKVMDLENEFVIVLAYIEYCGFTLDIDKWNEKTLEDKKVLHQKENALNQYIIENNVRSVMNNQLDLFSTEQKISINWASSKQVIALFKELGINTKIKEGKDSVEAKNISRVKHSIIKPYLEYKEADKVCSTYGDSVLKKINSVTGRLHSNFTQIMDTGRLSSGGKDKDNNMEFLNMQNLPPEARVCFRAAKGNNLIISDYSGQEQIVLANKSLDATLLEFYDKGLADMHSFIAAKMYPELEGLSLDEIKSQYKDKRQEAKIAGFAINYGGVGATIAEQLGKPMEEGNKVYDAYFRAFPGLRDYFEKEKYLGLKRGYILISRLTNRKCYIPGFNEYLELQKIINREFWEKYKYHKEKQDSEWPYYKETCSKYFKIKGTIEKQSLNYPIQGESSEVTKLSLIYFFKYLRDNNLLFTVKIVNTVHDENVVDCPIEIEDKCARELQIAMEDAGKLYCQRVKLKAEPVKSLFWNK